MIGKLAGVSSCSDAQIAAAKARERRRRGRKSQQPQLSRPTPKSATPWSAAESATSSPTPPASSTSPAPTTAPTSPWSRSRRQRSVPSTSAPSWSDLPCRIDPETAEVFVDAQGSDPIPHIVDGIPVHLRDIRAYVDRPEFHAEPDQLQEEVDRSDHARLGPELRLRSRRPPGDGHLAASRSATAPPSASSRSSALSLKGGTKRGATPAFKAVLTYPKGPTRTSPSRS